MSEPLKPEERESINEFFMSHFEPQEWTAATINTQVGYDPGRQGERETIARFHNAALAASDNTIEDLSDLCHRRDARIEELFKELAAERKKREQAERKGEDLTISGMAACGSLMKENDNLRKQLAAEHENLMKLERDWFKVISEVLKCGPIPARDRTDDQLEPPWEVIARIRKQLAAEREKVQWCEAHEPTADDPIKCCPCCEAVNEQDKVQKLVALALSLSAALKEEYHRCREAEAGNKPLVEALEGIAEGDTRVSAEEFANSCIFTARRALAKVKDVCREGHPILDDNYCEHGHIRPVQK
jgi:hypothetical protein